MAKVGKGWQRLLVDDYNTSISLAKVNPTRLFLMLSLLFPEYAYKTNLFLRGILHSQVFRVGGRPASSMQGLPGSHSLLFILILQ